jgi:hypothetical protein
LRKGKIRVSSKTAGEAAFFVVFGGIPAPGEAPPVALSGKIAIMLDSAGLRAGFLVF